jgi:hypothetical protein
VFPSWVRSSVMAVSCPACAEAAAPGGAVRSRYAAPVTGTALYRARPLWA